MSMKAFSPSLSQKVTVVIMLTTVIALLIACSMIFFNEIRNIGDVMTHKHSILAATLGTNCKAALAFRDHDAAGRILSAVKADLRIELASLYDRNNQLFAEYRRGDFYEKTPFKSSLLNGDKNGQYFTNFHLITFRKIILDNEQIGAIVLVSDLKRKNELVKKNFRTMGYVIMAASLIVFIISIRLQRIISDPIIKLKNATTRISKGEFDTRLEIQSNDEIGELVSSFNRMAETLRISRDELIAAKNLAEESERKTKAALIESEKLRRVEEKALQAQRALTKAEKQRTAAEEANRTKSEFLANMSHELRTPLHGILSFAGFGLKKYNTVEPQKLCDYFQHIENSGKTLLSLLNDLLDLSKLESGKMNFHFEKEDITAWIDVLVDEFKSLTSEKNIKIEFHKPNFSPVVSHDSRRLMQVLRNLLSNAIKFSNRGDKIQIKVNKKEDAIQVSVQDEGIGIPEQELETIFEKFIQSTKTQTGAGGTGLGLSICREIILAHNGTIWAQNNANGGAKFSFSIPIEQEDGS